MSLEPPHPPYHAPAAGVPEPDPGSLVLRGNVPDAAAARARGDLAGYYAHIQATDRSIGALLRAVPADTHVVVTSVHGDMHGSQGLFRKGWPHEESVRVPLLVRAGGAPRVDDRSLSLSALPSLAKAWADGAGGFPGEDPGFARISMPSVVPFPDQCDRPWRGVRTPTRKLVLNDDGSPWLFFHLDADPLERTNLAPEPDSADEMEDLAVRLSL